MHPASHCTKGGRSERGAFMARRLAPGRQPECSNKGAKNSFSSGGERRKNIERGQGVIKGRPTSRRGQVVPVCYNSFDISIAKAGGLYPEVLANLSQMLLKPVAEELGRKRLLIVTTGALQYVPFGALPSPVASEKAVVISSNRPLSTVHRPLIVDHEIVSLPSASVNSAKCHRGTICWSRTSCCVVDIELLVIILLHNAWRQRPTRPLVK